MPKISLQAGSTSVSLPIFIQASTSTAGLGLTGLAGTSAGLQAWYYRGTGTATPITLTTSSLNAPYTSGLFVEINATATGLQGGYRFDPPDACWATASGVRSCLIGIGGAASMVPLPLEVELTGWNNQIAVQTSVLAPQVHTGAIVPITQTASGIGGTVVLAAQVHTAAIIPIVQTASNLGGTVVLAAQVHTAAIIPIVQTASNLGGTVVLAQQVHTAAIIPVVQTASSVLVVDTVRTATLSPTVHTGAIVPIVQTASNLVSGISGTATVILAPVVHTGAVVPIVQTASNVISVVAIQTSSDGRMVNLDLNIGAVQTSVASRAIPGDAMTLTGGERVAVANAIGTTTRPEPTLRGSGASGTPDQLIYELAGQMGQHNITSTGTVVTKNIFKADGTSTAARFSIQVDTSTQPTGISRA